MPKPSSKPRLPDPMLTALAIVEGITGEQLTDKPVKTLERVKNAAAVELGKLGGAKGGRARAEKLSPAKRRAIAKKAAAARWG